MSFNPKNYQAVVMRCGKLETLDLDELTTDELWEGYANAMDLIEALDGDVEIMKRKITEWRNGRYQPKP